MISIKVKQKVWNLMEQNCFQIYYHLFIWNELRKVKKYNNRLIKKYKLKILNDLDISQYKKSNTLFVLGSGASINQITDKQWGEIRSHDSIGFNLWLIHDFVPTYYVFELTNDKESKPIFYKILRYKATAYKNTPIIKKSSAERLDIKQLHHLTISNLYLSNDIEIPGNKKLNLVLKKYNRLINLGYMLKKRASLSYMIFFGLKAGYKNIVLCGIDLNNTNYFYDEKKLLDKINISIKLKKHKGNVHRTMDRSRSELTIEKVVLTMKEILFDKNDINLFIGSKLSALYPDLPYYFKD